MLNVLIFGDSITWGSVDPEGMGWANRLQKHTYSVTEGEVQIFNLGISADSSNELLKRIRVECEARKPEVILFAIGINDSVYFGTKDKPWVPQEKFKKNLFELIEIARDYTDKIVFVGLTRVEESKTTPVPWAIDIHYTNNCVTEYDSIIEKTAKEKKLEYIKLFDLLDESDLFDGVHPNSEGHKKIFEKVKEELEKLNLIE